MTKSYIVVSLNSLLDKWGNCVDEILLMLESNPLYSGQPSMLVALAA